MAKEFYSEMSDRELAEHIARNSDQIGGFCQGMVTRLNEIRDGRITLPRELFDQMGMGIGTSWYSPIGSGPGQLIVKSVRYEDLFCIELTDGPGNLFERRDYSLIPASEWRKARGYRD